MASFISRLRSFFTRKDEEKKKRKQPQKQSFVGQVRRKALEAGAAIQRRVPEPVRTPKAVRKAPSLFRKTISKGMGEKKPSFRSVLTRGALEAGAAVQRRVPKSIREVGEEEVLLPAAKAKVAFQKREFKKGAKEYGTAVVGGAFAPFSAFTKEAKVRSKQAISKKFGEKAGEDYGDVVGELIGLIPAFATGQAEAKAVMKAPQILKILGRLSPKARPIVERAIKEGLAFASAEAKVTPGDIKKKMDAAVEGFVLGAPFGAGAGVAGSILKKAPSVLQVPGTKKFVRLSKEQFGKLFDEPAHEFVYHLTSAKAPIIKKGEEIGIKELKKIAPEAYNELKKATPSLLTKFKAARPDVKTIAKRGGVMAGTAAGLTGVEQLVRDRKLDPKELASATALTVPFAMFGGLKTVKGKFVGKALKKAEQEAKKGALKLESKFQIAVEAGNEKEAKSLLGQFKLFNEKADKFGVKTKIRAEADLRAEVEQVTEAAQAEVTAKTVIEGLSERYGAEAKNVQKHIQTLRLMGEKKSKKSGELFREHIPRTRGYTSSDEVASALNISESEYMAEIIDRAGITGGRAVTEQVGFLGRIGSLFGRKPKPRKIETIKDPMERLIYATQRAKPQRRRQQVLYSQELSKRAARVEQAGAKVSGEERLGAQLEQMGGKLPTVEFESLRKYFKPKDIDSFFDKIQASKTLLTFEKVNANIALRNLLGVEGGKLPTAGELSLLSEVFPKEFIAAALANRTNLQTLVRVMGQAGNLPRTLMASADFSGSLRQAVFAAPAHPVTWFKAFVKQFQVAFSEKNFGKLMTEIFEGNEYKLGKKYGLAITKQGGTLGEKEEAFMAGELASKIPVVGKVVRASERAYVGFLNKFRADLWKDAVKKGRKLGYGKAEMDRYLQDSATLINNMTGRGTIPQLKESLAVASNAAFFSPKLQIARMSLLNPVYYARLQPEVRKEALKSLAAFAGTGMTILALAKLNGAEVGLDPRNANFGKIKVGNTRYDIWGGYQQYIRLIAQLSSGQIISSSTGKKTYLGEGFRALDRLDIAARFAEYKTAPIASLVLDIFRGETALGEKLDFSNTVVNRVVPMMLQDLYEVFEDTGEVGAKTAVSGVLASLGVGVQTYGKYSTKEGKLASDIYQDVMSAPEEERKEIWESYQSQGVVTGKVKSTLEKIKEDEDTEVAKYIVENLRTLKGEEKKAFMKKAEDDGVLTEKVEDIAKRMWGSEKFGIPEDLKERPVEVRAKYIFKMFETATDEDKEKLWTFLKDTRIATDAVEDELKRMKAEINYKKDKPGLLEQFRNLPLVP